HHYRLHMLHVPLVPTIELYDGPPVPHLRTPAYQQGTLSCKRFLTIFQMGAPKHPHIFPDIKAFERLLPVEQLAKHLAYEHYHAQTDSTRNQWMHLATDAKPPDRPVFSHASASARKDL